MVMIFKIALSLFLCWASILSVQAAPAFTETGFISKSMDIETVRPSNIPYFKLDNSFEGRRQRQALTLDEYYKAINIDRFKLLDPDYETKNNIWTHQVNIDHSLPDSALVASVLQESFAETSQWQERSEKIRHLELLLNTEQRNSTLANIQNTLTNVVKQNRHPSHIRILGLTNDNLSQPPHAQDTDEEHFLDSALHMLDSSLTTVEPAPKTSYAGSSAQETLHTLFSGSKQNNLLNDVSSFNHTQTGNEVFTVTSSFENNALIISIHMRGKSYIYQDTINIKSKSETLKFQKPVLPKAVEYHDVQGSNMVYFHTLKIEVPILAANTGDKLILTTQGCDEQGICYPPLHSELPIPQTVIATTDIIEQALQETTPTELTLSDSFNNGEPTDEGISNTLQNNLLLGLLLCFLLGIGLDLTPCVLPMLPIFSAMIVAPKKPTVKAKDEFSTLTGNANTPKKAHTPFFRCPSRNLLLQNTAYALGLSLTYMILGLLFSILGASFHSVLQSPIVTITIALLLVICACACAGIINLKVPTAVTSRLQNKISTLKTQTFYGAFILGVISALIASPCTSAPLAGALLYVMTSGNLVSGALSFLAIGLGMSFPLFIIGIFGVRFLQRSGIIGDILKRILVLVLLFTAYFMVKMYLGNYDSIVRTLLCYVSILYIVQSIYFFTVQRYLSLQVILCVALLSLIPTYFLYQYLNTTEEQQYTTFVKAHSVDDIAILTQDRPSIIVFTANWCTNCRYMERTVYSQEPFLRKSANFNRVLIDITDAGSDATKELIQHFNVIGVPFYITMDSHRHEVRRHLGIAQEATVLRNLDDVFTYEHTKHRVQPPQQQQEQPQQQQQEQPQQQQEQPLQETNSIENALQMLDANA